jgi:hypothetical protein
MKARPTQLGVRENTASSRQHVSRLVLSSSLLKSERSSTNAPEGKQSPEQVPPPAGTFHLSLGEPENGATGEARDDVTGLSAELNGRGERSGIERPLTCEEAAQLVRVHPKTVKRMAQVENFRVISALVAGFSTHLNWTAGCEQSYIHRVTRAARTD